MSAQQTSLLHLNGRCLLGHHLSCSGRFVLRYCVTVPSPLLCTTLLYVMWEELLATLHVSCPSGNKRKYSSWGWGQIKVLQFCACWVAKVVLGGKVFVHWETRSSSSAPTSLTICNSRTWTGQVIVVSVARGHCSMYAKEWDTRG